MNTDQKIERALEIARLRSDSSESRRQLNPRHEEHTYHEVKQEREGRSTWSGGSWGGRER